MQWGKIVAVLSILIFCSVGQAQYTFSLTDNDGTADAVELAAGDSFTVEVHLEAGGPLVGFTYMLSISEQGSGLLTINEAPIPEGIVFEDPITLSEDFVGMVLDPSTDRDLGLLNDEVDVNEPADSYHVRTVTLTTDASLAAGDYTLAATGTVITIYDPGSLFIEEEADAIPYTITVTAEEGDGGGTGEENPPPPPTNSAPDPDFSFDPEGGEVPITIAFDASATTDPDGDELVYSWDFGDGLVGEGQTVEHTYSEAGDYQVTLTVDDGIDGIEVATASVVVTGPAAEDDETNTGEDGTNVGDETTDNQDDDTTGDDETTDGGDETNTIGDDTNAGEGDEDETDNQVPTPPDCGAGVATPMAICGLCGLISVGRRRRQVS